MSLIGAEKAVLVDVFILRLELQCNGLYPLVLPMGCKNAPQMTQTMMEDVLFSGKNEDLRDFCSSVYIGDIMIATPGNDFNEPINGWWRIPMP